MKFVMLMNKKNILLCIILIICIAALVLMVFNIIYNNKLDYISKILNLDINNCKLINYENSHDGFLGDGEYYAKLNCTTNESNIIKDKWTKLPLSEELNKALDIKFCSGNGCSTFFERYNIQEIKEGYYYFYDRHSDAINSNDEKIINDRSSYNFSIGLFDSDSKNLYFYELDT